MPDEGDPPWDSADPFGDDLVVDWFLVNAMMLGQRPTPLESITEVQNVIFTGTGRPFGPAGPIQVFLDAHCTGDRVVDGVVYFDTSTLEFLSVM